MEKISHNEQPRVFLSYAHEDSDLVNFVADFLAPLPVPVFLDTRSITPGQKWEDRIVDELQKATHVYIFWSRHAAASEWVTAELELAIDDGKVVIPVSIDDTPLPHGLSDFMRIDVRFVAGVNRGLLDAGYSIIMVRGGQTLLEQFGVSIDQLLSEPWAREGEIRPDGFNETDPRLVALGMYGLLAFRAIEDAQLQWDLFGYRRLF